MRQSIETARSATGGASLLLIGGLIATYPHPEYRPGVTTLMVIVALLPSLLTIAVLLSGGSWTRPVISSLSWFPLCWSIMALPIAFILSLNVHTYLVVLAMPLQIVALPLLVFTRDSSRLPLLQRIVRVGLAGMFVAWIVASWLFAGYVQATAAVVAKGAPHCLSVPTPGAMRSMTTLSGHYDLLLLQRLIAYPARHRLTRYRLQASIPGAVEEQWHFSFLSAGFEPGGELEAVSDCARTLAR